MTEGDDVICFMNGKRVHFELSEEAQKDLEDLQRDLNLAGISDKIICYDHKARDLMLEQMEDLER